MIVSLALWLILVVVASLGVESFTPYIQQKIVAKSRKLKAKHEIPGEYHGDRVETSRRAVFQKAFTGLIATSAGTIMMKPTPSNALQPRNEQLCATGFFTNFLEYRCTDIGDISDEGKKTSLSSSEMGATDSLLDKINLDFGTSSTPDDNNGSAKASENNKETQQPEKTGN